MLSRYLALSLRTVRRRGSESLEDQDGPESSNRGYYKPSVEAVSCLHGAPLGHARHHHGLADSLPSLKSRSYWDFEPQETPRIVGDLQRTHSEYADQGLRARDFPNGVSSLS